MLRSKMGFIIGGVAALVIGIGGGRTLLAARTVKPVERASMLVTTPVASADQSAPTRTASRDTATDPTPIEQPSRAAEAPPPVSTPVPAPAPAVASPAPAREAVAPRETSKKPRIRLDGERSELSYGDEDRGVNINKDRLSLRTPLGKYELEW